MNRNDINRYNLVMERNHFGEWLPVRKPALEGRFCNYADVEQIERHNRELEYELRQECFQHQLTKQKLDEANKALLEYAVEHAQMHETIRLMERQETNKRSQ